jgi:hypothetical protein
MQTAATTTRQITATILGIAIRITIAALRGQDVDEPKSKVGEVQGDRGAGADKGEGEGRDEGRDGGRDGGLVVSQHRSLRNCWSRRQE